MKGFYVGCLLLLNGLMLSACEEEAPPPSTASILEATDCRRFLHPVEHYDESKQALVNVSFANFQSETIDNVHHYLHHRYFNITNGIGGNIYRGKVCIDQQDECVDSCINYRVDPWQKVEQTEHRISVDKPLDLVLVEYWFRDDFGNVKRFSFDLYLEQGDVKINREVKAQ